MQRAPCLAAPVSRTALRLHGVCSSRRGAWHFSVIRFSHAALTGVALGLLVLGWPIRRGRWSRFSLLVALRYYVAWRENTDLLSDTIMALLLSSFRGGGA